MSTAKTEMSTAKTVKQQPVKQQSAIKDPQIKRVGIIFAGGPAPAANAVISSTVVSFLDAGREVIGFFHGYSNLQEYHPVTHRLLPDRHYRIFEEKDVRGIRNGRGILIGTARANPGKGINSVQDLDDPSKTERLRNVYTALIDLEIDALISIGGDDTLKTANFLYEYQKHLPAGAPRVRIVHLPKTIDNDYHGIDFTFGFFTAVDFMAREIQNLRMDAMATGSWFIVETMGRKAGWLSYGVAIAGEAHMVVAREDIDESISRVEEFIDPETGKKTRARRLNPDALAEKIVDLMISRERRDDRHYGIVVVAEGLAEELPDNWIKDIERDQHGHISLGHIHLGQLLGNIVSRRYHERTGNTKKVRGVQLGYEARCQSPHAFDVMLGSQLGIGAYRALVEEQLDGHMVSVSGQLDLHYVPFRDLIDGKTMKTQVRFIKRGSDFHKLARFLEIRTDPLAEWDPGPQAGE